MKLLRIIKAAAVCLACWGMLIPQPALHAAEAAPPVRATQTSTVPAILDVALSDDGTVTGRVIDEAKHNIEGAIVSIRQGDTEVATTHADKNGGFVVQGLRGGVYQIMTEGSHSLFRLWAPSTAPPKALEEIILVTQAVVVRGQSDVVYDERGNAYGRVRIVDTGGAGGANVNGPVYPPPMGGGYPPPAGGVYPVGWSGGLFGGLDIITLTTVSAAIGAVVIGALILDDVNDDDEIIVVPVSP